MNTIWAISVILNLPVALYVGAKAGGFSARTGRLWTGLAIAVFVPAATFWLIYAALCVIL